MLDVLREDGAKVVGFDITFDKPDQTGAPVRTLAEKLEKRKAAGQPIDPRLKEEVQALAAEYDADKQFGEAIQKFGKCSTRKFLFSERGAARNGSGNAEFLRRPGAMVFAGAKLAESTNR